MLHFRDQNLLSIYAISQYVSRYSYNGLLKNHASVLKDKDLRVKAREISKKEYTQKTECKRLRILDNRSCQRSLAGTAQ